VPPLQIDLRIRYLKIQIGWDQAILQSERRFDDSGKTTHWLGVSNICLYGPDDNRVVCFAGLAERPGDGFGFDGVSSCCSSHVGFNVAGVFEIVACTSVAFPDKLDLGVCRRRGNCCGPPVLIEPGLPDDCVDSVTSLECSVERLEYECCDTLATTVTVGTLIPGKTFAFCADSTVMVYPSALSASSPTVWDAGTEKDTHPMVDAEIKASWLRRVLAAPTTEMSLSPVRML